MYSTNPVQVARRAAPLGGLGRVKAGSDQRHRLFERHHVGFFLNRRRESAKEVCLYRAQYSPAPGDQERMSRPGEEMQGRGAGVLSAAK